MWIQCPKGRSSTSPENRLLSILWLSPHASPADFCVRSDSRSVRCERFREGFPSGPPHHFHGGNQLGRDAVGNKAGEAILFRQHVADSRDFLRAVLDSRHNGFQNASGEERSRLNFSVFPSGTPEEGYQIHSSAFHSEVRMRVEDGLAEAWGDWLMVGG